MYNTDNLAYDLSLFDSRMKKDSKAHKENVIQMANLKKAKLHRQYATKNILTAGIVAIFLSLQIFSYTALNELTNDTIRLRKQYEQLQNEEKRLSVEADRKIDLKYIEDVAINQYNMQKIENYQVEYISLLGEDHSVIVKDQGITAKVKNMVNGLFKGLSAISEYLK